VVEVEMVQSSRARLIGYGFLAVLVAVIAVALALGGSSTSSSGGGSGSTSVPATAGGGAALAPSHDSMGTSATKSETAPAGAVAAPARAPTSSGALSTQVRGDVAGSLSGGVTATRLVKTGSLSLQVKRGQVAATVSKLVALTSGAGGYVSKSRTDNEFGSPTSDVTLRIPASAFDNAVSAAEKLGRVTSLTTGSTDVTGKYVDLSARLNALTRTRATYLTILGRATTIGSTLEVQQRVDDVQQQIEELQGELKVLRNQSADGTLTVDVTQVGAPTAVHHQHRPSGIGHAWHKSVSRFNRGFDSIVGALGPLLLALLVLFAVIAVAGVGYLGLRRAIVRRATT
jgi:Domain of unknown function (DUF4349)